MANAFGIIASSGTHIKVEGLLNCPIDVFLLSLDVTASLTFRSPI